MRKIKKFDQEVYDIIILGNKMNIGSKVFNSICTSKNFDSNSADYWFYKALFLSEQLQEIGSEMEIFDLYEELLDCCDVALEIEMNHWPASFFRSLFSLLIQEFLKDEDETIQYLIPCYRTYEEQLDDINVLLDMQKEEECPENFISYCLKTLIYLEENKLDEAIECLNEGFKTRVGKINYLSSLFKIPVYKIYYHEKIRDKEIFKELKSHLERLELLG